MMMQQYQPLFSLILLLIFISHSTKTLAQGPAAAPAITSPAAVPLPPANAPSLTSPVAVPAPPANAPAPTGPTNISKILEKAGGFNILIRLLKSTQIDKQLYSQLNNTNSELTLLAPSDGAFSNLGSLNSLSDEQKTQLLQFHLIPDFISTQKFQTISNPVRTQAGDGFEYPLNITTSGNAVNISTGLVNTSISGTVYSDGQLAIYQVDSVLQPYGVFAPKPPPPTPAPAPALAEEKPKKKPSHQVPVAEVKSGAVPTLKIPKINGIVSIGVTLLAAAAMNFL
ncbi:hypothetical protein FF1_029605 [Malus domestica]|uniref:fasciclin-like arabinogalactan protein 12 n=1 Tax=Malus sylvestris TaxID=3752 RepID=UPI0021ACE4C0|nr:fasciclin-like arabinogalactan protein 12 [Malus sylvestris]